MWLSFLLLMWKINKKPEFYCLIINVLLQVLSVTWYFIKWCVNLSRLNSFFGFLIIVLSLWEKRRWCGITEIINLMHCQQSLPTYFSLSIVRNSNNRNMPCFGPHFLSTKEEPIQGPSVCDLNRVFVPPKLEG